MTAAEKIYHASTIKNTISGSLNNPLDTSSCHSARLNVSDVSAQFNLEYYNTMSRQPEHLHGFYGKQSQMVHSVEGDLEAPICTTLEAIHARVMSMGFQGARIIVESIDAQASLNGGIFILTTGNMRLKSGGTKRFAQSFFLAEQPNGYYVLNDCFRFLDVPAAANPAPLSAPSASQETIPKAATAAVPEPKPAAAEPVKRAASPAKQKPQVANASEAPVAPKPAAVEATPSRSPAPKKSVEEAPKKSAPPSSWASLAAGGSGMWQNGVVAPTKAPVVTVASEQTAKDAGRREPGARSSVNASRSQQQAPTSVYSTGDRERRGSPRADRPSRSEAKPVQDFSRSVFIRNLGSNPDALELRKALETSGVITSLEMHAIKGQAFVEFETVQMATKAIGSKVRVNGVAVVIEARRPVSARGGDRRPPRPE